jgi:hypothetical protein
MTGAGDGNRTNPNEPNKGVTTRSAVQLESNGVKLLDLPACRESEIRCTFLRTEGSRSGAAPNGALTVILSATRPFASYVEVAGRISA